MTRLGWAARRLTFARDEPTRAVVEIPVEGRHQAHSWDLRTGRVVQASAGAIAAPTITPDGNWLWWFDLDAGLWLRSRFGASSKGPFDRPLRLLPTSLGHLALGADGTAVVALPQEEGRTNLSLLPVGRMRPGAEPVFLGRFEPLTAIDRSRNDALTAVQTPGQIHVLHSRSGAVVNTLPTRHALVGFTRDGELLLHGPARWRLWNPSTGFLRDLILTLPPPHTAEITRVALDYLGTGLIVEVAESTETASPNIVQVFTGRIGGGPLSPAGPAHGLVSAGSAVGGPGGEVYAIWHSPTPAASERLVHLTAAPSPKEASEEGAAVPYPPVVGGIG